MTLTLQQGLLFWPGIILVAVSCWLLAREILRGPNASKSQERQRAFKRISLVCMAGALLLLGLVFDG
jgi:hypothetical protein